MGNNLGDMDISWHPGFYGAIELELIANKGVFDFQREYNLSKEPLRMDLLIIRKLTNVPIKNEIGYIFKKYNIVEYKSPNDGLTYNDYYKTLGYACLYKGLGDQADQVLEEEMTVSIFRDRYPRELFRAMKKSGLAIEEAFPGIYYIRGKVLFYTQIVVTNRLKGEAHKSLRLLSHHVQEEDAKAFIREAEKLKDPRDRNNIEAILQVSIAANQRLYNEIRRQSKMCEALRNLMREEIAEEKKKARQEGLQEGREEGRQAGLQEGRQAGLQEGRQVGLQEGRQVGLQEGRQAGLQEGRQEARQEAQENLVEIIKNLMTNMKLTADQALSAMNIPAEKWGFYKAKL